MSSGGPVRQITVIGAGQMGAGIAQVAAVAGFDVTLTDVAAGQLERAMMVMQGSLTKLVE
jgi:3-hydroxyacyl-CoA dehydrogenase